MDFGFITLKKNNFTNYEAQFRRYITVSAISARPQLCRSVSAITMQCLRSVTVDCVSGEERYGYKKCVERNIRHVVECYVYVCIIGVIDFGRTSLMFIYCYHYLQ